MTSLVMKVYRALGLEVSMALRIYSQVSEISLRAFSVLAAGGEGPEPGREKACGTTWN